MSVLVECAEVVVGTFDSVSNCLRKVLTDRAALCNARSVNFAPILKITFLINLFVVQITGDVCSWTSFRVYKTVPKNLVS